MPKKQKNTKRPNVTYGHYEQHGRVAFNRSVSNLLKLANFIWEKVKTKKEPKKRTFQNQLLRPEIAAHSDIIHSPFQGKTILFQL